jgi:predicted nucleotidyltransferase
MAALTIPTREMPPADLATLQTLGERVAHASGALQVIAFGSVARGEQHMQSDLDLLLLLPTNDRQTLLQAAIQADEVFWNFKYAVDIVPMSFDHYQRRDSVLARRIAREGIVIHNQT